jgi:TusE/DsrC/DsvC family sulfur relay protein
MDERVEWRKKRCLSALPDTQQELINVSIDKITVPRNEEGYLIDPEDWSPELALTLATEEGLALTEEHWIILTFVREYFAEHQITPDIRHVAKYFAERTGCDKKAGKQRIFELFPYGYVKQTCKVAGMMRPRAWSTG